MRHWTHEERQKQRAAIRRWAPWKKSTGPVTADGKEISKMNALKHGQYCRQAYEFRATLRQSANYFKFICHKRDRLALFQRNELLKTIALYQKNQPIRLNKFQFYSIIEARERLQKAKNSLSPLNNS